MQRGQKVTLSQIYDVRDFHDSDAEAIASIYYHTIHRINCRDYSPEQVEAWAPLDALNAQRWREKHRRKPPLVAECKGRIVGFVELEDDGHIDCFYCHHDFQRQGVGSALMRAAIERATARGLLRLYAEVSITARAFFERWGFETVTENRVEIRGVELQNTIMERRLTDVTGKPGGRS